MKSRATVAALLLLLCGCVTTPEKPEPPIRLAEGMGGLAIKLTIDPEAIKNLYFYTVAQYDPKSRKVLKTGKKNTHGSKVRHNFSSRKGGDFLWLTQLPPGHYAITEIEAKLSPGPSESQIAYAGDPISLAIGGLLFLAIAEGSTDVLPFTDENGILLPDAPVFRVEAGKMTYAGHLIAMVDPRKSEFPEYDREGHWDGETMIIRTVKRYMADYRYDENDLTEHRDRLNLSVYPLLPQPLAIFDDRRFILEDYYDAKIVRRSIPRSEYDTPTNKEASSTGTPAS